MSGGIYPSEHHGAAMMGLLDDPNDTADTISSTRTTRSLSGTEFESSSVVETVVGTAQDRSKTLAFNLASQALNNSFFLSNLVSAHEVLTP